MWYKIVKYMAKGGSVEGGRGSSIIPSIGISRPNLGSELRRPVFNSFERPTRRGFNRQAFPLRSTSATRPNFTDPFSSFAIEDDKERLKRRLARIVAAINGEL